MANEKSDFLPLGWAEDTTGELDHRMVKAPYVRLSSWKKGVGGDVAYLFDIRVTQPNVEYLSTLQLHSLEHCLLAGFRKYLPCSFINVAPMGCQTGFYLTTLNECRAPIICEAYRKSLLDIVSAKVVPYVNLQDCGQFTHHDLKKAKAVAKSLLEQQSGWLDIIKVAA